MPAPKWFEPMSLNERAEFSRLFRKATGLALVAPPAERDDPASWIVEIERSLIGMMRLMHEAQQRRDKRALNNRSEPPLTFDPRDPHKT